jgi:hypothetical protein
VEKFDQSGEHTGGAETTLESVMVGKCLLQWVERAVACCQPFDSNYLMSVGLHRQHQAGSCRSAVDKNGAGSANSMFASEMSAGQTKLMAQEICKRSSGAYRLVEVLAVDANRNAALIHIVSFAHQCF